jgi:hypothetical protein
MEENECQIVFQNSNLPLPSSPDLTLSALLTIEEFVGLVLGFAMAIGCSEANVPVASKS